MGFFRSLMNVITTDGKTGTPFQHDKNHAVYYKGSGVTKLDAAMVGSYFEGYGYFTAGNQSDVQIFSQDANSPVKVSFIVGSNNISADAESFFRDTREGLQELFKQRHVTVSLMNAELKEIKQL